MTDVAPGQRIPFVLKLSMVCTLLGALVALVLFLHAGPYELVGFMMLAQPLLFLGIVLFVVQVLKDLRKEGVLKS